MDYYKSNAIYEHIETNQIPNFKFCVGNMWQLVYGDSNCEPKLLVLAIGSSSIGYDNKLSINEIDAYNLLKQLADKRELPLVCIKFNTELEGIERVKKYNDTEEQGAEITLSELSGLFAESGLPVSNTSTAKYLNDRTSSAYHKWQRGHLGRSLTVSDIDLWNLNNDGSIKRVIELKRSFIDINRWKPYPDDYRNFQLISKTVLPCRIRFGIVYNVRHKNPFNDDISRIKVFPVNFNKRPPITLLGIYNKDDFFNL
jgi:hypothetical protein